MSDKSVKKAVGSIIRHSGFVSTSNFTKLRPCKYRHDIKKRLKLAEFRFAIIHELTNPEFVNLILQFYVALTQFSIKFE